MAVSAQEGLDISPASPEPPPANATGPAHPEVFKLNELGGIVDPNFLINRDTCTMREKHHFMMSDRSLNVIPIESKLSLSYPAKLYGRIRVTAKQPRADNMVESWKAFKRELTFIAKESSHWHNHPNILQYYGLVFYKDDLGESTPYLLSERVDRNLVFLLDAQNKIQWSQRGKVSVVYDIACGLSFLHSRKPHPIVHRALSEASVLINNERKTAKISNFVHAGHEGEPLNVISVHDLNPKCEKICTKKGAKLECVLDMISLGYLVKAIDDENERRVRMTTDILRELYALYDDHKDGSSSTKYSADHICEKLFGYLENQEEGGRNKTQREQEPPPTGIKRVTQLLEKKFVGLFAAGGEDKDVAEDFHEDLFGRR